MEQSHKCNFVWELVLCALSFFCFIGSASSTSYAQESLQWPTWQTLTEQVLDLVQIEHEPIQQILLEIGATYPSYLIKFNYTDPLDPEGSTKEHSFSITEMPVDQILEIQKKLHSKGEKKQDPLLYLSKKYELLNFISSSHGTGGLVFDRLDTFYNEKGEYLRGFYAYSTRTLYVSPKPTLSSSKNPSEKDLISYMKHIGVQTHELSHAISCPIYRSCKDYPENKDRSLASYAVDEGTARYIEYSILSKAFYDYKIFFEGHAKAQALYGVVGFDGHSDTLQSNRALSDRAKEIYYPPYEKDQDLNFLLENEFFPYEYGLRFVYTHLEENGRDFKDFYTNPPVSSQQIMQWTKYDQMLQTNTQPKIVQVTALDTEKLQKEKGVELLQSDVMGQLQFSTLISKNSADQFIDFVDIYDQGWDGDRYWLLSNVKKKEDLMVSVTYWDSEAEAKIFENFLRYFSESFPNKSVYFYRSGGSAKVSWGVSNIKNSENMSSIISEYLR
ncbi:MAG: hypothetical protein KDD52_01065 [Bdellovibrionales bacterium]|nr:hypothetical protein [Bdellovibrionales bacterium]